MTQPLPARAKLLGLAVECLRYVSEAKAYNVTTDAHAILMTAKVEAAKGYILLAQELDKR